MSIHLLLDDLSTTDFGLQVAFGFGKLLQLEIEAFLPILILNEHFQMVLLYLEKLSIDG